MSAPAGKVAIVPAVIILDELVARAGRAREVLDAYETEYAPGARQRGMRRLYTWVSPPTLLPDGCNTIHVAWLVDGFDGWWQARTGGRDPEVVGFWERLAPLLVSRSRRHCADPADLARLEDVF